jgi:GT2 family glycosyltransferase
MNVEAVETARPLQDGPLARIGIVAIGRNEGDRLEKCLLSLLGQSQRVVYADSSSSDMSVTVARRLGVEVVELPSDTMLSAAAGRAAGFERLRNLYPDTELVQFVDGDCVLERDWLTTAETFFRSRPRAAVVCGRRFEAKPGASIYNAMCDAEWDTPVGPAQACGGDALFRVAPYEAVGGFRGDLLAGEEPELCRRLRAQGWEVWRIDSKMTEHDARMLGFGQWWRRSLRGGYGYAQVWDTTRKTGEPLYGRQLASALGWAFALPMTIFAVALLLRQPWALAAIPVAYLTQALRIFGKVRVDRPQ